jgi:hypothetical protein
VRQVAAVRQVHAEDRVARLQRGQVHGHVRLRAGVGLHVGVLAPKSAFARSIASCSILSTNSQPP